MAETPGLYLRLNVTENLEYFGGLYGLADPGPRIGSALEAVRLTDRANDACGSLSKGLRQRVALARALLNDPEIIFLDEPTSGLDPVAAQAVHELIDDLRKSGVTIFLTTHRLDEAERLCDRVGIFSTTLRTVGRPDEMRDQLFNRALSVQTATPLAAPAAVFGQVASIKSWITQGECTYLLTVTDPTIAAPEVIRILVRDGADVLSVSPVQHSLEDVYMQIVSRTAQAASP
jgi:ABC-2 type transport system ATP-binding protein